MGVKYSVLQEYEKRLVVEYKPVFGLIEAKRKARRWCLSEAIGHAETIEDLKPVLLRLLNDN